MASDRTRIYASGGYSSLPFNIDENATLFALDPRSNSAGWSKVARLPAPLGQHSMVYNSGAVWLVGGERKGKTTGSLLRYDLDKAQWQEMASMPTPRHSHAVAMDAESLIVLGGRSKTLGNQSRVVEAYDFTSNKWRSLPETPFDLAGHGAIILNGRLHVFGGENLDTGEVLQKHATLDLTNLKFGWQMAKDIAYPRHGFAAAKVGNEAWIIGGGKRAGLRTPWSVTGTAFSIPLQ
jgi:N-acetylneuraminic acid mutarotase